MTRLVPYEWASRSIERQSTPRLPETDWDEGWTSRAFSAAVQRQSEFQPVDRMSGEQ
jgi:hypothetical protein